MNVPSRRSFRLLFLLPALLCASPLHSGDTAPPGQDEPGTINRAGYHLRLMRVQFPSASIRYASGECPDEYKLLPEYTRAESLTVTPVLCEGDWEPVTYDSDSSFLRASCCAT